MRVEDLTRVMRAAGATDAMILKALAILDDERLAKGRAKSAKCRNNNNKRDRNDVTNVTPLSPPQGPQTPKESPPLSPPPKGSPPDFSEFWAVYPHKVGKGQALRAWPKALKSAGDLEIILDGVRRYIRDKPPDCPPANPATWLNGMRWTDEPRYVNGAAPKPVRKDPITGQVIH